MLFYDVLVYVLLTLIYPMVHDFSFQRSEIFIKSLYCVNQERLYIHTHCKT